VRVCAPGTAAAVLLSAQLGQPDRERQVRQVGAVPDPTLLRPAAARITVPLGRARLCAQTTSHTLHPAAARILPCHARL